MKWMIKSSWGRTATAFVLLVVLWPTLVMALPLREAGIVTTLSGKASVTRVNLPQTLPLHFKDPLYLGDKISTAEDSIVRVLLGGKALVTVRELSVFSITEKVGKSTVNLTQGKISLAVARQRMRPGESVEVRTPNAVAAVRGTVLVVEVEPALTAAATPGPAVTSSTVTVIKGTVTVGTLNAPNSVTVGALQSVKVVGQTVGAVQNISPAMAAQVLKNLKPPQQFTESDEDTKKRVSKVEQAKALALAKVLMPELFPIEEKPREGDQGQDGGGDAGGGDVALADASASAGSPSGSDAGSSTTTIISVFQTPIVSTTLQTQEIQEIVSLPPLSSSLIIPSDQIINTDQTFSLAQHGLLGAGGTLDGTGTVTVTGLYDWQSGVMTGTGITEAQGGLSLGGNVTLDRNRTLNISGTSEIQGDVTVLGAGTLANAGTLTKVSGTGVATINPVFNNSGTVAVNSGTLALTGSGTSTGSFTVASGSALNFSGSTHAVSGVVGGAGALAVNGGFVTLAGANIYGGGTTVSGGVLEGTTTSLQGAITDNATVRFNQTTTGTYAGILSGTGTLEKSGTGTVTLSGANTYDGATTITAGTLTAAHATALGSTTGATTVAAGANLTVNNVAIGAEALTLNGGTALTGQGTASIGGGVTLATADSTITVGSAEALTLSGVVSGANGLTKAGTGTLVLSGANTYDGASSVNAGTLVVSDPAGLGNITSGTTVAAAGTLEIGGVAVGTEAVTLNGGTLSGMGAASLGGSVTLGSASTVTAPGVADALTLNGTVSGPFTFTKSGSGTVTISSAFNNTSGVSVTGGTLQLTGGGTHTSDFAVGTGTTLAVGATHNVNAGSSFTGGGNLTVSAGGTLNLNVGGAYEQTGTLTVTGAAASGGSVNVTGDLVSLAGGDALTFAGTMLDRTAGASGTVSVSGAVAKATVDNNLVNTSGATLVKLTGGSGHGLSTGGTAAIFDISGTATSTHSPIDLGTLGSVTLVLGTEKPIQHNGQFVETNSVSSMSSNQLAKVDRALLEATLPILMASGSTLTLSADAVTLANMAKLVAGTGLASAMFTLDGSSMTINVGALINVTGGATSGSYLNVLGDLVRLSNSSTMTLMHTTNGFLVRVSGNSVVDIFGALTDFVGTGNKVKVANTYNPINNPLDTFINLVGELGVVGGLVRLTGGAQASQVEISGTPLRGLDALGTKGTIEKVSGGSLCVAGVCTGSLIEINGTASRVRIRGN